MFLIIFKTLLCHSVLTKNVFEGDANICLFSCFTYQVCSDNVPIAYFIQLFNLQAYYI